MQRFYLEILIGLPLRQLATIIRVEACLNSYPSREYIPKVAAQLYLVNHRVQSFDTDQRPELKLEWYAALLKLQRRNGELDALPASALEVANIEPKLSCAMIGCPKLERASFQCGGCQTVFYCSNICQTG